VIFVVGSFNFMPTVKVFLFLFAVFGGHCRLLLFQKNSFKIIPVFSVFTFYAAAFRGGSDSDRSFLLNYAGIHNLCSNKRLQKATRKKRTAANKGFYNIGAGTLFKNHCFIFKYKHPVFKN
jgi:hypothetical protein